MLVVSRLCLEYDARRWWSLVDAGIAANHDLSYWRVRVHRARTSACPRSRRTSNRYSTKASLRGRCCSV
jgi:hypothetical protein